MTKRHSSFFFISLILALTGCSVNEIPTTSERTAEAGGTDAAPAVALLYLSEDAADGFEDTPRTKAFDAIGIQSIERVFPDAGPYEARHRAAGLHRWYRVSYDPAVSQTKAGEDLGTLPGVESVDFPPRKARMSLFNDPLFGQQWHYSNTVQRSNFKAGCDINVEPVWEQFTTGSRDVIVAVVDGGVDGSHEDLAGVVLSVEEGSRNFVHGYEPEKLLADDHGSHVGGTIAAINNNGIGVCGIAGGHDGKGGVRLMTCHIFGKKDSDYGDDAAALVWAADHGAVIANCSWGNVYYSENSARQGAERFLRGSSTTKSAIDYFTDYAGLDENGNQIGPMKGGLIFFASGNDGYRYGVPAIYDRVVAVAAHGPDGRIARFANYGEWVDLVAPGGSDSNYTKQEWVLSSVPKNKYDFYPGTSMASPHAAGVAALLVSYFGGPGFTNEMLRRAMLEGANKDFLNLQGRVVGGGMLDAYGAFQYMIEQGGLPEGEIAFLPEQSGPWEVKSHLTEGTLVRISGNHKKRLPVTFETDCPGLTAFCSATRVELQLDALKAEPGTYSYTIRVGTEASRTFPLTILPNHAPELALPLGNVLLDATDEELQTFEWELDKYFQDPDGEAPVYTLSVSGDPVAEAGLTADNKLAVKAGGFGHAVVTISATDARKAACDVELHILGRDASRTLDIYPNPVEDWLHVRPDAMRLITVSLYDRRGNEVYGSENVAAGPFQPVDIDMKGLPAGTYTLHVNGEEFTIAKK